MSCSTNINITTIPSVMRNYTAITSTTITSVMRNYTTTTSTTTPLTSTTAFGL